MLPSGLIWINREGINKLADNLWKESNFQKKVIMEIILTMKIEYQKNKK